MLFQLSCTSIPCMCLALLLNSSVAAQDEVLLYEADILHGPASSPGAMVKSRARDDLYWLGNTSSDDPRIFAIRSDGSNVIPTFSKFSRWYDEPEEGKQPWEGFRLLYADQQHWLDMTSDGTYLYILEGEAQEDGDAVIYALGEIDPTASTQAAVIKRLAIDFPDTDTAPEKMALFTDQEQLFLLATTPTGVNLFGVDTQMKDQANRLVELAENVFMTPPHAAELSPDSEALAVLSSGTVTVFGREGSGSPWQNGMHELLTIEDERFSDAETLVWNSDTELLVGTSVGKLYRVQVLRQE